MTDREPGKTKGGVNMATSSITHNFVIKGAAVEAFVKAIDESEAAKAELKRPNVSWQEITDPNELRALMDRWENRHKANGQN